MSDLDALENESVHILREAYNRFDKLALLLSLGKDSNVLVWLARKAFFGHVPEFPPTGRFVLLDGHRIAGGWRSRRKATPTSGRS